MSLLKAAVSTTVTLTIVSWSVGLAAGHGGGRGGFGGGFGGYGRGFGGYGGFGYGRGFGGYGGFGYGRGFGYGGWGFGYGYGIGYYPGYYGYGYPIYAYSGVYPSYGYSGFYPSYSYGSVYSSPVVSTVYLNSDPPVVTAPQPQPAMPNNKALIHVTVPADAQVWFEGQATTRTGTERDYYSPELPSDNPYAYNIKARWMQSGQPIERTLTVKVQRNKRAVADFNALPPKN